MASELQVSFDLGSVKVEERDHDLRDIITNFQFIENEEDNASTLHEPSLIASNKDSTKKSKNTSQKKACFDIDEFREWFKAHYYCVEISWDTSCKQMLACI